MQKNFKEQFVNLRSAIFCNIHSLKNIIFFTDGLNDVINSMNQLSEEEKKNLQNIQKRIDKSNENMVDQVCKMFEAYEQLVKKIYGS